MHNKGTKLNFLLTSTEAALLLQFERNPSLESLAKTLGRDPTAISRQLKRIHEQGDFLTKVKGRWKLTSIGEKFNQTTKDYLLAQNKVVNNKVHLKIGSTREFCSKILSAHLESLKASLEVDSISIISFENTIEAPLLSGEIDIGFDCGRPYSPEIMYKKVLSEPISPMISRKLKQKYQSISSFNDLEKYPHILCDRIHPDKVSKRFFQMENISCQTNDVSVTRNLCLSSQGWALLPQYTVKEELRSGKLHILNDIVFEYEKFGVWCLRSRPHLKPIFEKAIEWMGKDRSLLTSTS